MIGSGIVQGMFVTLREFFGSYAPTRWVLERAGGGTTDGTVTVEYPERKVEHPERFRYFPFLVYDGTPENLRCVSCKICEQECPPQCIYIEVERDPKTGKPVRRPRVFDIDYSVCMQCQICAEVCPFDAIKMDNVYELAGTDRFGGMVTDKSALLKANKYFHHIHPNEADEVDARLSQSKKKAAAPKPAAMPITLQPTPPDPNAPKAPNV